MSIEVTVSCNYSAKQGFYHNITVMCPQNLQSEQLRNFYPSTDGNGTTNETGRLRSVSCRAAKTHTEFLLEIRGKES
jgi:hypothetical protein